MQEKSRRYCIFQLDFYFCATLKQYLYLFKPQYSSAIGFNCSPLSSRWRAFTLSCMRTAFHLRFWRIHNCFSLTYVIDISMKIYIATSNSLVDKLFAYKHWIKTETLAITVEMNCLLGTQTNSNIGVHSVTESLSGITERSWNSPTI